MIVKKIILGLWLMAIVLAENVRVGALTLMNPTEEIIKEKRFPKDDESRSKKNEWSSFFDDHQNTTSDEGKG